MTAPPQDLATTLEEPELVGSYSRLQFDGSRSLGHSDSTREQIVAEVFQGSLVHYGPEKRKLNKLEKHWVFSGPVARFLGLRDIVNPAVWRATINELVATAMMVFVSISAIFTCLEVGFSIPILPIALAHFVLVSFMILGSAPASGGHMNPGITLATMWTGFTSPTRALLYVAAQCAGSIAGASLLKFVVPAETVARYSLAGCKLRSLLPASAIPNLAPASAPTPPYILTGISARAGLAAEFSFSFVLYYFCYNLAMDPKQFTVTGPLLSPFMLGAIIGSMVLFSGGLAPGYSGAGMNPARCLGPAVALDQAYLWEDHWVYWVGPLLAGLAHAALYYSIPPHHLELYSKNEDVFSKGKVVLQKVRSARFSRSNSASSSRNGGSGIEFSTAAAGASGDAARVGDKPDSIQTIYKGVGQRTKKPAPDANHKVTILC